MSSLDRDASSAQPQAASAPRRWFQVKLADVAVWVFAAAIASALGSRWYVHSFTPAFNLPPLHCRIQILAVLMLSVGLVMRLASQVSRLGWGQMFSAAPLPGEERAPRAVAMAWRAVLLCLVVWLTLEISGTLPPPPAGPSVGSFAARDRLREELFPLCGLLVMIGLLIGLRHPAPRIARRARFAWISSSVAAVLAVGLLAGYMVIPHLVFVAMEAVDIARHHYLAPHLALAIRIDRAGPSAAIALVATVATAAWIVGDLRLLASAEEYRAPSWPGTVYRISTFAAMVASAAYVTARTIPWIHEWFSAGMWDVLGPVECTAIVVALMGLSAGIVARAIGRYKEADLAPAGFTGLWKRLGLVVAGCVLLALIAMAIAKVSVDLESRSGIARALLAKLAPGATHRLAQLYDRFLSTIPVDWALPVGFWLPASVWTALEMLRLCGPGAPDVTTSFDAVFAQRGTTRRFFCFTTALTTLCICALPTLFVAALIVYQFRLMRLG